MQMAMVASLFSISIPARRKCAFSPTMILAAPRPMIVSTGSSIISMASPGNMISTTSEFGTGDPAASITTGRGTSYHPIANPCLSIPTARVIALLPHRTTSARDRSLNATRTRSSRWPRPRRSALRAGRHRRRSRESARTDATDQVVLRQSFRPVCSFPCRSFIVVAEHNVDH